MRSFFFASRAASLSMAVKAASSTCWEQEHDTRKPPVGHELHAPQVDLLVAAQRALGHLPGFGEGRGIEDHQVVFFALVAERAQEIEAIVRLKICIKPVGARVVPRDGERLLGDVHARHVPARRSFAACSAKEPLWAEAYRAPRAPGHDAARWPRGSPFGRGRSRSSGRASRPRGSATPFSTHRARGRERRRRAGP